MQIEIDQSGKIESTSQPTVIGFSNEKSKSILISAKDKRELQEFFRNQGQPRMFIYKVFSLLIFFLIKKDLPKIQQIIIDKEYPDQEYLIKDYLLRKIRQLRSFDKQDIIFSPIGKKSNAHGLSIAVFRRKKSPDIIITKEDLTPHIKTKRPGL